MNEDVVTRICGYTDNSLSCASGPYSDIACRPNTTVITDAASISETCGLVVASNGNYTTGDYVTYSPSTHLVNDLRVIKTSPDWDFNSIYVDDGCTSISEAIAKIDWNRDKIVKLDETNYKWSCLEYREVKLNHIVKI